MACISISMKVRPICPACKIKPVAISNRRGGHPNYRNRCDQCYRKNKKPAPAGWIRSGYKKKLKCEKCGFKFKYTTQSDVFHIDGNMDNNNWVNLKTVCLNCVEEVKHSNLPWTLTGLTPDF